MSKLTFDEALVRRLSDLLQETGLTEIEYEADGRRIRVARASLARPAALVEEAPPAAAPAAGAKPQAAQQADAPDNAVTAPMVGTVYLAPEPTAPPFVKVGDRVEKGQTLVIIEAMKVMNPIPSPRSGSVTQVLVQDGQPVEFGEPLMIVD